MVGPGDSVTLLGGSLYYPESESPLEAAAEFDEALQVFGVLKDSSATAGIGSRRCAQCGLTGHNKRTCPSRVKAGHSASTGIDPTDCAVMAFESSESRERFVEGVRRVAGAAPAVMRGGPRGVHLGTSTMSFQTLLQHKAELEALRCDAQNLNVLQKDTVTPDDLLLALRPAASARPVARRLTQPASLPAVNKEVSRRINANDPRPAHIAAGHSRPKVFGQRELSDLEQVCKSVCTQLGMKGWEFGARKPVSLQADMCQDPSGHRSHGSSTALSSLMRTSRSKEDCRQRFKDIKTTTLTSRIRSQIQRGPLKLEPHQRNSPVFCAL